MRIRMHTATEKPFLKNIRLFFAKRIHMPNLAENIGKHRKQKMEIDNLTHNLPLWHICIQGLNNIDIVRDNKDRYMFLKKMAVAFYARERPGNIVAYCLLDNHFHIMALGNKDSCKDAYEELKKTYSQYYSQRYGQTKLLKHIPDAQNLCDNRDYQKDAIGYTLGNCVKHRLTTNAFAYRWSSLRLYFDQEHMGEADMGDPIPVSPNQMSLALHTKKEVPSQWKINREGNLLMSSVLNLTYVERMFGTMNSLSYYAHRRRENKDLEINKNQYNDQNVRKLILEIAEKTYGIRPRGLEQQNDYITRLGGRVREAQQRLFNKQNSTEIIHMMNEDQKGCLFNELHFRFGIPASILKRVMNI